MFYKTSIIGILGLAVLFLSFSLCTEESAPPPPTPLPTPTPSVPINISGRAHNFSLEFGYVSDANVTILEYPEFQTTTDSQGNFNLEGVPAWRDLTFVLTKEGYPEIHTETFFFSDNDVDNLTFQAPPDSIYRILAGILGIIPEGDVCQVASTVSTEGENIWDVGEPGSTVSIDPVLSEEQGPYYFNEMVLPDKSLSVTSTDGGVAFINLTPGIYYMTAHKEGVDYRTVKIKCEPGVLINASPPWGLQGVFIEADE